MALSEQQVRQVVNRYIGVSGGYLGDFSYRTHTEFYPEYCGIYDIFPEELDGTTRERFIAILTSQTADRQARILRGVLERFPSNTETRVRFKPTVTQWIAELEGEPIVASPQPSPDAIEVVRRALMDADNLVRTSGPVSAVDRIHTALHGHLKALCGDAGIPLPADASLQTAMKKLRENHPGLQPTRPRADDVSRVLYSMASTLDALNTLRNNASAAHPNEDLLGDAEALLAINAGRTIFTYVDQKVRRPVPPPAASQAPEPWGAVHM